MQQLLRHVSRPVLDSIAIIGPSRSIRPLSARSSIRTSTCIQCQLRPQRRHFADESKPTSPPTPSELPNNPSPHSNGTLPSPTQNAELPSTTESRRSPASKRLSHLMDNMQSHIFVASQRLNDLTGYSGIEALKQRISTLEADLASCQERVRAARDAYKQAVADRAASQREVTTLLARKDSWTPLDLERFTSLYRSDHSNEAAVQEAQAALGEAERLVEQASNRLSTSILARYHEEQIWSDKIRRMSTWGTWGLMGVNVLIFLVFQFGFEPWRRRRLVRGFEEKVQEALKREKESRALAHGKEEGAQDGVDRRSADDETRLDTLIAAAMDELEDECDDNSKSEAPALDAVAAVISNDAEEEGKAIETAPKTSSPFGFSVERWKAGILDLFSDRVVSLKKQDVTIVALEGAVSGAGIVGLIMLIIRPH